MWQRLERLSHEKEASCPPAAQQQGAPTCNLSGLCELFGQSIDAVGANGLLEVVSAYEKHAVREADGNWERLAYAGFMAAGGAPHLLGAWLMEHALALDAATPQRAHTNASITSHVNALATLASDGLLALSRGGRIKQSSPFMHGIAWQAALASLAARVTVSAPDVFSYVNRVLCARALAASGRIAYYACVHGIGHGFALRALLLISSAASSIHPRTAHAPSACIAFRMAAFEDYCLPPATRHDATSPCAAGSPSTALVCAIGAYHTLYDVGAIAPRPSSCRATHHPSLSPASTERESLLERLRLVARNDELRSLLAGCAETPPPFHAACFLNVFNDLGPFDESFRFGGERCDALAAASARARRGCIFALARAAQSVARDVSHPHSNIKEVLRFALVGHLPISPCEGFLTNVTASSSTGDDPSESHSNTTKDLFACVAGSAFEMHTHVREGGLSSRAAISFFCETQALPESSTLWRQWPALATGSPSVVRHNAVAICVHVLLCGRSTRTATDADETMVPNGVDTVRPFAGEHAACPLAAEWWQ
jgi:hypothetical protein